MSNVDFNDIVATTGTRVRVARAQCSIPSNPSTNAPGQSFLQVVERELESDLYRFLVIGGGSFDITNLCTAGEVLDLDDAKLKTINSAHQLFSIVEASLREYPHLEKVILLKRAPRFDPNDINPMNLKPQLSSLANSVYFDLWCNSVFQRHDLLLLAILTRIVGNLPQHALWEPANLFPFPKI